MMCVILGYNLQKINQFFYTKNIYKKVKNKSVFFIKNKKVKNKKVKNKLVFYKKIVMLLFLFIYLKYTS
jgi:hypothetical protein